MKFVGRHAVCAKLIHLDWSHTYYGVWHWYNGAKYQLRPALRSSLALAGNFAIEDHAVYTKICVKPTMRVYSRIHRMLLRVLAIDPCLICSLRYRSIIFLRMRFSTKIANPQTPFSLAQYLANILWRYWTKKSIPSAFSYTHGIFANKIWIDVDFHSLTPEI